MIIVIFGCVIFLALLVYSFVWWYHNRITHNTGFLRKIPEVASSLPLLGVALDFRSTKDILGNLVRYTKTQGEIIKGKIGPFRQFILVSDYKFLECILSSTKLLTKSDDYHFLRPWLGTGLLTSDGVKWKTHRRVLTPAFHFKILEEFVEIFESCGDILNKKLEANIKKQSVDIYPYITLCSLDIICESIMGTSINAQSAGGVNLPYVRSVKEMCRIMMERSLSPIEMFDFLYIFTKNYRIQKQALKILHQQSNDVIEARRKELASRPKQIPMEQEFYFKSKKAFLDILLQSTVDGKPLTHEEIRQEVDTFLFEGHDTTSSALSFTLYCLANNPEVQKKAFDEQQNLFQNEANPVVTYADLQRMKYLELVIKESLRLYPSVPIYGREVTEDFAFGDEYVPKGITLLIFAYGIQRNPKYFEEPEKFNPERFENCDGKLPYANLPFSAGPRNCIGQKFAMLEIKSIVSKVLRKYILRPASPQSEPQLLAETILKSVNGVNISLELR